MALVFVSAKAFSYVIWSWLCMFACNVLSLTLLLQPFMPVRFDHKNICILSETRVRDRVGETRSVKQTHMTGLCQMHVRKRIYIWAACLCHICLIHTNLIDKSSFMCIYVIVLSM